MAIKKLYKSRLPSCKFLFKNGKEAIFINSEFATDVVSEIEELNVEIASGHPHIYIDDTRKEIDTNQMDPLEHIKAKAVADYIAARQKANDPSNQRGNTEQGKLNPTSSATISGAGAQSDSTAGAKLVNLKVNIPKS